MFPRSAGDLPQAVTDEDGEYPLNSFLRRRRRIEVVDVAEHLSRHRPCYCFVQKKIPVICPSIRRRQHPGSKMTLKRSVGQNPDEKEHYIAAPSVTSEMAQDDAQYSYEVPPYPCQWGVIPPSSHPFGTSATPSSEGGCLTPERQYQRNVRFSVTTQLQHL